VLKLEILSDPNEVGLKGLFLQNARVGIDPRCRSARYHPPPPAPVVERWSKENADTCSVVTELVRFIFFPVSEPCATSE